MQPAGKIELHLHLDCAASYGAVAALAPGTTFAEYRRDFVGPPKSASLADLLTRPRRIVALMQDRRGLRVITEDLFDQLARDGVVYAELRFAPFQHTQEGMRAEEVVEEFQGGLVAALDIAGDEAGYPLDAHEPAFRYAIERDLPRTAHAGESSGAASVWETLRRLGPARIGHGVRSIEDPALVAHLRERGTHLEVCPSSNVLTSMVDTYRDHPVDRLYRAGVRLGISTDVRTMIDTTLTGEYERLRSSFGWGQDDFRRCNAAALDAAFAPQAVKRRVADRLGLEG